MKKQLFKSALINEGLFLLHPGIDPQRFDLTSSENSEAWIKDPATGKLYSFIVWWDSEEFKPGRMPCRFCHTEVVHTYGCTLLGISDMHNATGTPIQSIDRKVFTRIWKRLLTKNIVTFAECLECAEKNDDDETLFDDLDESES